MMRKKTVLAAVCTLAFLTGCASLRPTSDKLEAIASSSVCGDAARALLVILPGRYDTPDDLVKNGFIRAVEQRGIDADVVIPDLHFGYYRERSAVDRLHEDVIAPAREKRYEQIWLAGISVGGLGSLLYAQQHPAQAHGLLLIAPYLGGRQVLREIEAAGGLRSWDPQNVLADDYERNMWLWLRDHGRQGRRQPQLYLGFGTEDGFAPANRLLAADMTDERVMPAAGGHEWEPWRKVWNAFLDKSRLPACARALQRAGTPAAQGESR